MGGSVSLDDRWQARVKIFADLQLTERASLFGYAYQQIDHRRSVGTQNDRDVNSFQFEPGAQYIINDSTGAGSEISSLQAGLTASNGEILKIKSGLLWLGYGTTGVNYLPRLVVDMAITVNIMPVKVAQRYLKIRVINL
jgi:hypothetical protein